MSYSLLLVGAHGKASAKNNKQVITEEMLTSSLLIGKKQKNLSLHI